MYALDLGEAFKRLRGDDPRPLLVVRECGLCTGSDDAFLSKTLDNEKTLLLSRWFHCVKLMHHVLKEDHTYSKLFPGKRPPHLFLASPDGSNIIPLSGTQSQSELWKAMHGLIAVHYERDAQKAVKEILKVLTAYDHLDSMEDMIEEQMDVELEKRGPRSPKLHRLKGKLAKIEQKKADNKAREKKVSDLHLKPKKKAE